MDVVSGLASVSQLLAYSHSTFQILIKLFKLVKDGPAMLKQQQPSIRLLLTSIDSLNKSPAPAHILTTLLELSNLATKAILLIDQSQEKGFLGLRWAAVRNETALSQIFASLREYREILHLAISIDTRKTTERMSDQSKNMGNVHSFKYATNKSEGDRNTSQVGCGKLESGHRVLATNQSNGNDNFNMVGNDETASLDKVTVIAPKSTAQQEHTTAAQQHHTPQGSNAQDHFDQGSRGPVVPASEPTSNPHPQERRLIEPQRQAGLIEQSPAVESSTSTTCEPEYAQK
ncbi:hypothetical protein CC80DRAFT_163128 [Byssothecium circinans]|uniref:Uncharacterized protein n=1 Tax=Byssothecium circinans TaxID=147558 RepID=A0A6A5UBL8_9PLEO|nr:hypothetical protein CC80DRAFT_163128 [Byssothecium circinans]